MHRRTPRNGSSSSSRAFTIVECLVVITVVALLATILVPAMARGRQRAEDAYCKNNLRQVTLATALYTEDFHAFPPDSIPEPVKTGMAPAPRWFSFIEPYTKSRWNGRVYLCPRFAGRVFPLSPPPTARAIEFDPDLDPKARSYGYNSWGAGWRNVRPYGLGLGGNGETGESQVATPDSGIVNPARMISFGDGYSSGVIDGRFSVKGDDAWIGGHMPSELSAGEAHEKWYSAASTRHSGKLNMAFCDGRVESRKIQSWYFERTENGVARWNNDDQAHLDLYLDL
jgi:prepilin-type processing-associated H-X9-DG protein/prepilin-type N-terminal cleavage/methylation domain-containing protein